MAVLKKKSVRAPAPRTVSNRDPGRPPVGRRPEERTGRSAPRSDYNPSWELLFAAVDPEHHSPRAFRESVEWNAMDLVRMAKQKLAIHDDKIRKLRDFCMLHALPLPLESDHPAAKRLKEIETQEMYERLARERLAQLK